MPVYELAGITGQWGEGLEGRADGEMPLAETKAGRDD
jgi:hypothetical protein